MKILGIETSCDETAVAIIEGQETRDKRQEKQKKHVTSHLPHVTILSNIVSSQVDLHAKYGGVVPEVAARAHSENMIPALKAALEPLEQKNQRTKKPKNKLLFSSSVNKLLSKIDVIAITIGPGLIGSLLVGVNTAKTLAYVLKKPIIGINHLEGHVYANFIRKNQRSKRCENQRFYKDQRYNIEFPILCLIVSGGHTSLVLMEEHLKYKVLGQTLDDAAGEAFDKVGKLLGLPYPGGPSIEKSASSGNPSAFDFPRAMLGSKDYNFSFSGLKTAVLKTVQDVQSVQNVQFEQNPKGRSNNLNKRSDRTTISDIAASFQQAVIDVLTEKTIQATKEYKVKTVILAGGVAANKKLREELSSQISNLKPQISFSVPPKILCTDNAAMIAAAGYFHSKGKNFTPWQKINADPNLGLT